MKDTETLRRAAALMRSRGNVRLRSPWLAVADLLDNEASLISSTETHPDLHMPLNGARGDLLLAVAGAYLLGATP